MVASWMLGLVVIGCRNVQNLPDLQQGPPQVRFEELKLKRVDFEHADAVFVFEVDNRTPTKLALTSKTWSLTLAGEDLLDGSEGRGPRIAASDRANVRIPVDLRWAEVIEAANVDVGDGDVPYEFEAMFAFETPDGAEVSVPLRHQGDLPLLHPARLRVEALRLVALEGGGQIAQLALDLELGSDQGVPVDFDAIDYQLLLEDTMVARGRGSRANVRERARLTIPFQLGLLNLPSGLSTAVRTGSAIDVRFTATVRVSTPLGIVPFDVDRTQSLSLR